jgi:lysophospholipid acyltransferase (LPLAT)-like uncharacterized protein
MKGMESVKKSLFISPVVPPGPKSLLRKGELHLATVKGRELTLVVSTCSPLEGRG